MKEFRAAPYRSVVEPIRERLQAGPERIALVFVREDESEEPITVGQLHAGASAYAGAIRASGLQAGEIVILALRHCRELIFSFGGLSTREPCLPSPATKAR